MSKYQFSTRNFLGAIAMAMFAGIVAMAMADYLQCNNVPLAGLAAACISLAASFVPGLRKAVGGAGQAGSGLAFMAVTREIWESHIEGNLFKNNEFLLASTDESEYVLEGLIVHIPQAGGIPTISVNNAFGPQTVLQRTDTDITYNLDVYSTPPIGITNAEKVELSYDKISSVIGEYEESLSQTIADYILTKWAPATNILRTTGIPNNDITQAPVAIPAYTSGATGQRLKFGLYDLKQVQTQMDQANVPFNERYGVLSVAMYNQLVDDIIISKYRESSLVFDEAEGAINGKLLGFKIYKRANVVTYDNEATPVCKAYGASGSNDDNDAGIFWQKGGVGRAKGPTLFFSQMNNPIYQADIYSFAQRMGARIRRANEENVVAMVLSAAPGAGS